MFQTITKRLLLLFMVLVMCLSVMTACKKDDGNEDNSSEQDTGETKEPSILDGVSFNNEELKILYWQDSNVKEYLISYDEKSTTLEQEIYQRCENAESQLNISTLWVATDGNGSNINNYVQKAESGNTTGEYDIFVCYSNVAAILATRGLSSNLKEYTYMDFNHPSWPQSLVEDCTVNDKLYFCTGDISTNLIFMTSAVFFNTDMVENFHINDTIKEQYDEDDLYSLVESGKWTYDAMFTLSENIYEDLDNSNSKTAADRYGFGTYNTLLDNFYYGAGLQTLEATENGFAISSDFHDAQTIGKILYKVQSFLFDDDDGFYFGFNAFSDTRLAFSGGRCMFSLAPVSHAYNTHSQTTGLNYSVLPVPKYTEDQDRYYSVHSIGYSMYSVSSKAKNADIAATFLQALAENSYDTTRIEIYDRLMKGKYSAESVDAAMWDYVANSQTFDMGRVFGTSFGEKDTLTINLFRNQLASNNSNWSGVLASYSDTLNGYCALLNQNMAK